MPELGTYGSLGGMARESCLYPEVDAAVYAPFCAIASLILAQKSTTTAAQLSKALGHK